jgi:hypothetical protein
VISVGTLSALWRFPVKSMQGEPLTQAPVDVRGVLGDRLYAVRDPDGKLGSTKNTRRFRRMDGLLDFRARYESDLTPVITLPDGTEVRGDDEHVHWAIAHGLGRPDVVLAKEDIISHFDELPLHIVTSASTAHTGIDQRRLRPSMVIDVAETDGRPEDGWVGRELHIGTYLVLDVARRVQGCDPTNPAPAELPADDASIGVHARVLAPGRIHIGDQVFLA